MSRNYIIAWMMVASLWMMPRSAVSADEVTERIERPVREAIAVRREVQQEAERWQAEREQLMARYEALEQDNSRLQSQQESLRQSTSDARERIAVKQKQLADIERISADIVPLIDRLIRSVQADIEEGLPFLMQERRSRVERLTQLAADPEVSVSEKFRRAMEALMVEAEYTNTIEVSQENISFGGQTMLVNILRMGRLALFYQTLDQQECGWFNVATVNWERLPRSYSAAIQSAVAIGAKRQPVEILSLPIGRMVIP